MTQPQEIQRHLILINPCHSNFILRVALHIGAKHYAPLPLYTIAGLTPPSYRITFYHQKPFWRRRDFRPGALVGITTITANAHNAYRLADRFRRAGASVVLGGPHASALPEEALEHADSVVIGEAESVWPEVIGDFENGALKKKYAGPPKEDFFSPVHPYLMSLDPAILRRAGIFISRGCKYGCDFCACYHSKLRFAKIEPIIGLVRRLKEVSSKSLAAIYPIIFQDDNLFSDRTFAKELLERLKPLKIRWTANAPLELAFDDELLALAKESGCAGVFIGIESLHPEHYPKTSVAGIKNAADILRALRKIQKQKIAVVGAFMIGLDYYHHADYLKLLWFLIRARLWHTAITILTPYPGTRLFERLKKENRIMTYDWRKYDLLWHVVFQPKTMSRFSVWCWFIVIRTVSAVISPFVLSLVIPTLILFNLGYYLTVLSLRWLLQL